MGKIVEPYFSARTIMNSKCIKGLMVGTRKKGNIFLIRKKVQDDSNESPGKKGEHQSGRERLINMKM